MTTTIIDVRAFHCTTNGSDKVWGAAMIENGGLHYLLTLWGKTGFMQQHGKDDGTYLEMRKQFLKKCAEKLAKGYVAVAWGDRRYGFGMGLDALHFDLFKTALPVAGIGPPAHVPVVHVPTIAPRVVVSHVMPMDETSLEDCLTSDLIGLTEKVNGMRGTIECKDGRLITYNRRGSPLPSHPVAAEPLTRLQSDFLIDGEIIGHEYVMFDLLEWGGVSIRHLSYERRITALARVLEGEGLIPHGGPSIETCDTRTVGLYLLTPMRGEATKRALLARLKATGAEGVIARDLTAASLAGNTPHERKFKFTADLDAIAVGIKPGSAGGSIKLALIRPSDGHLISIGSVRSGFNDDDVGHIKQLLENGEHPVLRVTFLPARTVGITLVEPNSGIGELRSDKLAVDCTTQQLVDILGPTRQPMIDAAPDL